ncbi:MAG: hypothetical protein D3903_01935 [Candidatus Electrothrix sp. GM3_4]|nr:hypothetical protein [Candidatus Electrothrix sp. GM3_4]
MVEADSGLINMGAYRSSKWYCVYFFSTVTALFGILLLYVFIFDPWQLFHQPWFREPVFINNARFQDAGIINSYPFDSVILGNSMAENFSAEEASSLLGGQFVNLSMSGSLLSERNIVLQHLFRKKDVHKVIISLGYHPYFNNFKVGQYSTDLPPDQYSFLYNSNPLDDFRIYFDVQLFRCWNVAKDCTKELPGARRKSLNELYPWFPYYVKAFGGARAWCYWSTTSIPFKDFLEAEINAIDKIDKGHKSTWTEKQLDHYRDNARNKFKTYLLPLIKEHPETDFLLFFPPYSRLLYSIQERYGTIYYQSYPLFIEDIVHLSSSFPNTRIFGFDDIDFTSDIANYKDETHYHKDINSKMLVLMAEQKGLLTKENLGAYIERIKAAAHDYDLKSIAQEFKTCLNNQ